MKITFDADRQYYKDELISIDFTFTFESEGMVVEATYCNDNENYKNEWIKILKALKNGKDHKITYCNSNGENSIKFTGGKKEEVVFLVSKYGCGGDGLMVLRVPKEICEDIFAEALKSFD